MELTINKQWKITSNEANFILERWVKRAEGKNAGKMAVQDSHYFPTLKQALNYCACLDIRHSDLDSLKSLVLHLDDIYGAISEAVNKAGLENNAILNAMKENHE